MKKEEIKITKEELSTLGIFLEDKGIKMGKATAVYQTAVEIGNSSIISWNVEKPTIKQLKILISILNLLITSNHKLILGA
ncbi:MAG: hypothetical protein KHZ27_02075 [Fusobacterium sp.]|jgi:hypothetical protein|nr:hypothetical protein [Fusobacterium sp.]